MLLWKIALRNIFRNKRRSGLTMMAIVFGSVAIILFGGFIAATYQGLRESTINSQLGHIQIFKEGYSDNSKKEPEKYLLKPETVQTIKS